MPEFKPTITSQLQKMDVEENIEKSMGKKEAEENPEKHSDKLTRDESNNKKQISVTKRIDDLNNIEKIRNQLGTTELRDDETQRVTQEKMAFQESLTGMKQQTTETVNPQKDLEKNSENLETEDKTTADQVGNDILLEPNKNPSAKIERKEIVPFDIKKLYTTLDNMLTVFNRRAMRLSRFDIMPQQTFDGLVDLHSFMKEKIIGKDPNEVADKVNLDLTNPDEINKEMLEKFHTAMESLQVVDPSEWHSLDDQYSGEYRNDMQDMRQVMSEFSQELRPFAQKLQKGPYADASGAIEAAAGRTNNFAGLFDAKVEETRNY